MAETFERVFRARWRFDRRKASEKGWVYSIGLNCLRDLARRRAVEERALEQLVTEPPGDPLPAVEDRDAVARALATLSDAERGAIALRYGADLTLPEIAKVAKLSLTTVEGRVYRALRKLREDLE